MADTAIDAGGARNCLLVINGGSSSIKFSVFTGDSGSTLSPMFHGAIEGIGTKPHFYVLDASGQRMAEHEWPVTTTQGDLLTDLINRIEARLGPNRLVAAGHRVAHGGLSCTTPQLITPEILRKLSAATPLAPLHQPHNLAPIAALATRYPGLPQVACFDTGFHTTNSRISRMYGLPETLTSEGLWRFGFHGLSYEYIAGELPNIDTKAASGRTIVAHLGNGASMCAMVNGKSVASTMGFSALDGLVMGSRCGALDPGVLLYLLQEKRMRVEDVEDLLYRHSGLLGVSGISSDVRLLLASSDARAREALELFVYRAAREIGSLAAAAGGLDALVFTAGIGEHAHEIRARICAQSAWLGINLAPDANQAGGPRISTLDSAVSVWVIPTNEELVVARHTFALTNQA
jgi:acetate kinase